MLLLLGLLFIASSTFIPSTSCWMFLVHGISLSDPSFQTQVVHPQNPPKKNGSRPLHGGFSLFSCVSFLPQAFVPPHQALVLCMSLAGWDFWPSYTGQLASGFHPPYVSSFLALSCWYAFGMFLHKQTKEIELVGQRLMSNFFLKKKKRLLKGFRWYKQWGRPLWSLGQSTCSESAQCQASQWLLPNDLNPRKPSNVSCALAALGSRSGKVPLRQLYDGSGKRWRCYPCAKSWPRWMKPLTRSATERRSPGPPTTQRANWRILCRSRLTKGRPSSRARVCRQTKPSHDNWLLDTSSEIAKQIIFGSLSRLTRATTRKVAACSMNRGRTFLLPSVQGHRRQSAICFNQSTVHMKANWRAGKETMLMGTKAMPKFVIAKKRP